MAATPPGLANLKLWMKLNDNAASSVVINEVGDNGVFKTNADDERNTNLAHVASGDPPYFNGAFNFEFGEVFHKIVVPDSPALSIPGDISFSFYMKRHADTINVNLLCKGIISPQHSYAVTSTVNGRLACWISGDGTGANIKWAISGDVLADNSWQHVGISYDADGDGGDGLLKLYIDAVQKTFTPSGVIPSSIHNSTEDLTIAKGFLGNLLDGRLDNIMIFNKVLTQENFEWFHNSGNGKEMPTAAPLLLAIEKV